MCPQSSEICFVAWHLADEVRGISVMSQYSRASNSKVGDKAGITVTLKNMKKDHMSSLGMNGG